MKLFYILIQFKVLLVLPANLRGLLTFITFAIGLLTTKIHFIWPQFNWVKEVDNTASAQRSLIVFFDNFIVSQHTTSVYCILKWFLSQKLCRIWHEVAFIYRSLHICSQSRLTKAARILIYLYVYSSLPELLQCIFWRQQQILFRQKSS